MLLDILNNIIENNYLDEFRHYQEEQDIELNQKEVELTPYSLKDKEHTFYALYLLNYHLNNPEGIFNTLKDLLEYIRMDLKEDFEGEIAINRYAEIFNKLNNELDFFDDVKICSETEEPMFKGFCVQAGELYFKYEEDLQNHLKEKTNYISMDEAYLEEYYYHSEWE